MLIIAKLTTGGRTLTCVHSTNYARAWGSSRLPPRRAEDGTCHMNGEVMLEKRDEQLDNYNTIKPLLDLVDKSKGLIVAPMPRYWNRGCCENEHHATNIGDSNYKQDMLDALQEVKRNLKGFLWHDGKRNIKVVDPAYDLKGMADDEMWGEDPVHPKPAVYAKLAAAVVKISLTMETSEGKRRRTGSLEAGTSREQNRREGRHSRGGPSTSPGHAMRGGSFRGHHGGYGRGRDTAGHRGGRGRYY
jgi:hypothetical protein